VFSSDEIMILRGERNDGENSSLNEPVRRVRRGRNTRRRPFVLSRKMKKAGCYCGVASSASVFFMLVYVLIMCWVDRSGSFF